jgi:mono/diheme cytochrome c family protein
VSWPRVTRRGVLALLITVASLAACNSRPPPPAVEVAEAERPPLRDRTREAVRPHCGECHTSSLATAKPGALAIFDLDQPDWGAAMSREQLETFSRSIARRLEPAGAEQVDMDAYVGDLLARAQR